MPIIAGIDEVGYGPKLGPLVVCATAFRAADLHLDLWSALSRAVARKIDARRIPVMDSKGLFSQAMGVRTIEPTVFSFLSMLPMLPGRSFRDLVERVSISGGWHMPWYDGADFALPQETDEGRIGTLAAKLWTAQVAATVMPLGCWAAWAEPDEFNRNVTSESNKSDFLFSQASRLIKSVLEASPDEDAIIRIGKQGGRRFYLPGLVREFGSVWIIGETKETSVYEFQEHGRRVRVEFLMDGEDRDFCIALSSIVGKYLREGAMRLFNEFWSKHQHGIRRTAGYGTDASRFFREIEPHLGRLRIPAESVLRKR